MTCDNNTVLLAIMVIVLILAILNSGGGHSCGCEGYSTNIPIATTQTPSFEGCCGRKEGCCGRKEGMSVLALTDTDHFVKADMPIVRYAVMQK